MKTGKACFSLKTQLRNPVTFSGFAAVSRNSIVMPDRPRVLKAAAEGVSVSDPHDRNPVTGDGMPLSDSITDPNVRKQVRAWTEGGALRSHFVIADDQGPPPTDSDCVRSKRLDGKRPSEARDRMFNSHTLFVGVGEDDAADPSECTKKQNPVEKKTTSNAHDRMFYAHCAVVGVSNDAADQPEQIQHKRKPQPPSKKPTSGDGLKHVCRVSRKRRLQPTYREPRMNVLAWSKVLGNVDDASYYIGDQSAKRLAESRDCASPITGEMVAQSQPANAEGTGMPVDVTAGDASIPQCGSAADDSNYHCCFHGDDDDDDSDSEDDPSEAGKDGETTDN